VPSAAVGKAFADGFYVFADGFGHSAKDLFPVVRALLVYASFLVDDEVEEEQSIGSKEADALWNRLFSPKHLD
jgi:hypothetical protein